MGHEMEIKQLITVVGNILLMLRRYNWSNRVLIQDFINGHASMKYKKCVKQPVKGAILVHFGIIVPNTGELSNRT